MSAAAARRFAFRPRYRRLAWASVGVGGPVALLGVFGGIVVVPIVFGVFGMIAGAAYLRSPVWKLEVVVDDGGLEVRSPDKSRFRVTWAEVVRVIASPTTHTCFVDGGVPAHSLIVPGVGAPAPYEIDDKAALFDFILAHVDAAKVETVERLELHGQPATATEKT